MQQVCLRRYQLRHPGLCQGVSVISSKGLALLVPRYVPSLKTFVEDYSLDLGQKNRWLSVF